MNMVCPVPRMGSLAFIMRLDDALPSTLLPPTVTILELLLVLGTCYFVECHSHQILRLLIDQDLSGPVLFAHRKKSILMIASKLPWVENEVI